MSSDQKTVFSKNLNFYLQLQNKSQKEVANLLGIGLSTFNSWCTGSKMPRMDKVQKLADFFGITKSDLIEDNTNDMSSYSDEYIRLTNLCNIGFKSVMTWTEDSFYREYEIIAIRDHFSDFLYRYKAILEKLNGSKRYWHNDKEELINFYKKRDPELTDKEIKEIFLKQELDDIVSDASNWISGLPSYIAKIEDRYENNDRLAESEKRQYFSRSAGKDNK